MPHCCDRIKFYGVCVALRLWELLLDVVGYCCTTSVKVVVTQPLFVAFTVRCVPPGGTLVCCLFVSACSSAVHVCIRSLLLVLSMAMYKVVKGQSCQWNSELLALHVSVEFVVYLGRAAELVSLAPEASAESFDGCGIVRIPTGGLGRM